MAGFWEHVCSEQDGSTGSLSVPDIYATKKHAFVGCFCVLVFLFLLSEAKEAHGMNPLLCLWPWKLMRRSSSLAKAFLQHWVFRMTRDIEQCFAVL